MLDPKQIEEIKKELDDCVRPIFFFHDDPDGLASFLLFYRYKKEGKGIVVKSHPKVTEDFAKKAQDFDADKVFVLDLAIVDQEFIDAVKTPVVWIDHHEPLKRHNVRYFNPRINDPQDNIPVSEICYNVVKDDLWIAMVGIVGDWFLPKYAKEFSEQYPDLLSAEINTPEDAMFTTKLGDLIKIFSFILKGKTTDVMKCIKILTRISGPYEILKQETAQGKFIYKRFSTTNREYNALIKNAVKTGKKSEKIIVFTYSDIKNSFTKELANELLYRYPDQVILIAREKNGEMKISLRARSIILPPIVRDVFKEIEGYGGGHEHACGAAVKKKDFPRFLELLESHLKS